MTATTEIKAAPSPAAPFSVSERAARRVRKILESEGRDDLHLRVSVSGGGCSGFQYGFSLDDKDEEGDVVVERDGVEVVIDGMSLLYLMNSEIDFVENLGGAYFQVNNPNAASSCGCGSSFAI